MGAETMQEIPFWKAVVITLGIIAAALGWMYVGSLLGFNDLWIPLVALTLWGAMGNDMKLVPGIFAGGAIGLLLALAGGAAAGNFLNRRKQNQAEEMARAP